MSGATVIIINFEDEATLPCALASLTLQTPPFDVIVVADGPNQRLELILEAFPDLSIIHIENERNMGRGASRQRALNRVRTPWVTFLDADDWYMPNKLSAQLDYLDAHPEVQIVSTSLFLDSGRGSHPQLRRFTTTYGELTRHRVPFAPSLIATDIARSVGFDTALTVGEDRPFLEGVLAGRLTAVLDEPLYVYRTHQRRSLIEELRLRESHIRQLDLRSGQGWVSAAREVCAGFGAQTLQRLGVSHEILDRSSRQPSPEELARFQAAQLKVQQICKERGV